MFPYSQKIRAQVDNASTNQYNDIAIYFHKQKTALFRSGEPVLPIRHADGSPWFADRISWGDAWFRVDDMENLTRTLMPTKLSDTAPYPLSNHRKLYPYEIAAIIPKRSIVETRNGNLCDVGMYFSVGNVDSYDLRLHLGGDVDNIFSRYGETDEDKRLVLNRSHTIRHLQNTELFRLGLADTLITKRFNRRSVTQSHVYDHRSLAEDLDFIDLPAGALETLPPKAAQVWRMIKTKRISGPIVDEFRRIEASEGEDAAFEFLATEADGFHATPYGGCATSFTVDPCPKHLECFKGCRHLVRTSNPEAAANLDKMESRFELTIRAIESSTVGFDRTAQPASRCSLKIRGGQGSEIDGSGRSRFSARAGSLRSLQQLHHSSFALCLMRSRSTMRSRPYLRQTRT